MKYLFLITSFLITVVAQSQETGYKKRVLESAEIEFLSSGYTQDGSNSSVSGGIGSENLQDVASNIVVSIPMGINGVLTLDAGISAYSSASSSNVNPFNSSGASGGDDDDDDDRIAAPIAGEVFGTPWQASSGASKSDVLVSGSLSYSRSSDSRKFIWGLDGHFSNEYDYTSIGFGGNISQLFNGTNSEVSLKVNAYLDTWRPIYPTELHEYDKYGSNFLNNGYFQGIPVYNENGIVSTLYNPVQFETFTNSKRNSYSASLGFSQVLTKRIQFSIFMDAVLQEGLLSSPYHRMYFADKPNYYLGKSEFIPVYNTDANIGVYQLADDIELLPDTRLKLPVGTRINFYLNERFTLRTYYRYYWDDWDITAHTANVELPIKLSDKFTISPLYRYYVQTASKYFAPFETHLSTEEFYTSDYDLSKFDAQQYGLGLGYTDIFTQARIWKIGLKNVDLRYNHYVRSNDLTADIVTLGFKFVLN
jgi:hypothetical protein